MPSCIPRDPPRTEERGETDCRDLRAALRRFDGAQPSLLAIADGDRRQLRRASVARAVVELHVEHGVGTHVGSLFPQRSQVVIFMLHGGFDLHLTEHVVRAVLQDGAESNGEPGEMGRDARALGIFVMKLDADHCVGANERGTLTQ